MLIEQFESLSFFVKPEKISIDNIVFQLHCKVTVLILMVCVLTVSFVQYFGTHIACMGDYKAVPEHVMNSYCWLSTTYSIPDYWDAEVGGRVVYPGVGTTTEGTLKVHHSYYQWVVFVLFLQAILFYLPKFLWVIMEGDKTCSLLQTLDKHVMSKKARKSQVMSIVGYLVNSRGTHDSLFSFYSLLELANCVNVICQMFLLDRFLSGQFWEFGLNFLKYSNQSYGEDDNFKVTPLLKVFPRMTKCVFHKTGPSGDIEKYDAYCLLSVNHVNEKIFIVLWFWFVFLIICSVIGVLYRILTWLIIDLRILIIKKRCPMAPSLLIKQITVRSKAGDWFLLNLLSKNMDGFNFKKLVEEYQKAIRKHCSLTSAEFFKFGVGKNNPIKVSDNSINLDKNMDSNTTEEEEADYFISNHSFRMINQSLKRNSYGRPNCPDYEKSTSPV